MITIQCELCGTHATLISAEVEGTTLRVCDKCSQFGKISLQKDVPRKKERISPPIIEHRIIEGYDELLKNAREKKGLKQEEVALLINEKLSLLQKIESGHVKPPMALAKKLEKFFSLSLIEEEKPEAVEKTMRRTESLTIGDLIKGS